MIVYGYSEWACVCPDCTTIFEVGHVRTHIHNVSSNLLLSYTNSWHRFRMGTLKEEE